MELFFGLLLVLLAGLGTGTGAWPLKIIKDKLCLEKYMLVGMSFGLIVCVWTVVLASGMDVGSIIAEVGWKRILFANLFSLGWGVANVMCMICFVKIGAALTGAILSALGLSFAVCLPMVFKGTGPFQDAPDLFSSAGCLILGGVFFAIIGILFATAAGAGRQKQLSTEDEKTRIIRASGDFRQGLILVVIAGILSAGLSLCYVYGSGPITDAAKSQGATDPVATCCVWALAVFAGACVNVGYPVFMLCKNKTWHKFAENPLETFLGFVAGLQMIGAIFCLGHGMTMIGTMGAAIGVGIQQTSQVLGNQLVGFLGGEWKGVTGRPRKLMYVAIAIITVTVVYLALITRNDKAEQKNGVPTVMENVVVE